jgi:hypothetical protein
MHIHIRYIVPCHLRYEHGPRIIDMDHEPDRMELVSVIRHLEPCLTNFGIALRGRDGDGGRTPSRQA